MWECFFRKSSKIQGDIMTTNKPSPSATNKKFDPAKFFVACVTVSAVIYFVIYLIIGNGRFSDVFFKRCADFFMDFFNSVRDASQGSGVYTERGVIYPPMANLIFLIMSRFTPNAYNDTSFSDRYEWSNYFPAMMLVVMLCTAIAMVYFFIVYTRLDTPSRNTRFAFAFLSFFSVPVLYTVERGNMILFCVLALMIYGFTYNSNSKLHRELGLIALAFAFSIKLYPVVFGWFLIADKRIKDALRCALYGILMLLLPSFFFGGPVCFVYVFDNIFNFSTGTGSTLTSIFNYLALSEGAQSAVTVLTYAWVLVCGLCFAISPFIKEQRYKTWVLGLVTILCVPSLTSLYGWAFFVIPLVIICNKKERTARDIAYTVLMTIPFMFLPFRIMYYVATSTAAVYFMTAALSIWAVTDTAINATHYIKTKRLSS